jgi:HPr kinase/phosphorylase
MAEAVPPVTTRDLYLALRDRLALDWVAGEGGAGRSLGDVEDARTFAGPLNFIHPNRIQVVGRAEADYLETMPADGRREAVSQLFEIEPAAVVLADGVGPDALLLAQAEGSGTPLLRTPLPIGELLEHLQYYSSIALAERVTLHGVFLEVLGMGVLITGDAAVGKSELALELVSRGSRLIADDAAQFSRIAPDIISGTCPPVLQDFLEVRGLGIVNIRAMFGDSAIKRNKYLRLIVRLRRMTDEELATVDRLSGCHNTRLVLGLEVPEVTIPVAPGRNMGILVETAVRNHMLKLKGYDASTAFIESQRDAVVGDLGDED